MKHLFNRKKIAVLFFGQPRQLEKGAEFIKPFFDFSEIGVKTDYFFHGWTMVDPKKTNRIYQVGHEDQETLETASLLKRITELYDPISIRIDDPIRDKDFTKKAQKFVDLWKSIEKTKPFLDSQSAHEFLSNISFAKYKIGQLVSSERVVQSKADYEQKHDFEYDIVFRIRTDMAYKPSALGDKIKYIVNGLRLTDNTPKDLNQIYVEYLKISNGVPLCGDQNIWGKSKPVDKLFTGCTDSFLNYTERLLNRCSEGYYKEDGGFVRGRFLHIEIAIPVAGMDHDCSLFAVPYGPNNAGSHSLVRDTVEPTDDYGTIHSKHCDFFK
jgi:hypothetical protein